MRAGITLDDVGLVEVNEAFAAQSLAVLYEWGMDPEDERLNPNGGAIALGHPLGASGARILTTLLHEMQRRDEVSYGLATMCIGVGQGIGQVGTSGERDRIGIPPSAPGGRWNRSSESYRLVTASCESRPMYVGHETMRCMKRSPRP